MSKHDANSSRAVLNWRSLVERFRSSLMGIPALWIIAAIVLWWATGLLDRSVDTSDLWLVPPTTVGNARALLGAVASGTIAAASVVFSLTLVAVQLSTSTYSTRVLRTFLRDPFQQNMIGIVVATFLFSLLVLREVRGPIDSGGSRVVPNLSVTLAVLMGLAAVIALLGSISHTSRQVRVSHLSNQLVHDTTEAARDQLAERGAPDADPGAHPTIDVQAPGVVPSPLSALRNRAPQAPVPAGTALRVPAREDGWVQQIGIEALFDSVEAGSTIRLEVAVGTYVYCGTPLVSVWSESGELDREAVGAAVHSAVRLGSERTLQQDIAFGLTMLEDIALRALSPGVNDPNTARQIIVQMGGVLLEILSRELPPAEAEVDGIRVFRASPSRYEDYLEVALAQITHEAAEQPAVLLTIVRTLLTLARELERRGAATGDAMAALRALAGRVAGAAADGGGPAATGSLGADPDRVELDLLLESAPWDGPSQTSSKGI